MKYGRFTFSCTIARVMVRLFVVVLVLTSAHVRTQSKILNVIWAFVGRSACKWVRILANSERKFGLQDGYNSVEATLGRGADLVPGKYFLHFSFTCLNCLVAHE